MRRSNNVPNGAASTPFDFYQWHRPVLNPFLSLPEEAKFFWFRASNPLQFYRILVNLSPLFSACSRYVLPEDAFSAKISFWAAAVVHTLVYEQDKLLEIANIVAKGLTLRNFMWFAVLLHECVYHMVILNLNGDAADRFRDLDWRQPAIQRAVRTMMTKVGSLIF